MSTIPLLPDPVGGLDVYSDPQKFSLKCRICPVAKLLIGLYVMVGMAQDLNSNVAIVCCIAVTIIVKMLYATLL